MPALAARLARLRTPLARLLFAVGVLHAVALTWGLPASDGWDNDGIAPRDFFVGVIQTYSPGEYFTYPPVHLLLLAILNAPVALWGALHAASFSPPDVVRELIHVPYMTTFALVARLVTLAMSLGIVWSLAKIGEELKSPRAGLWIGASAGVDGAFTYYAHTTNLDVPYAFWGCLAVLFTCRAIARGELKAIRKVGLFAALAVGTKDQAYALFLVSLPLAIASWLALGDRERPSRAAIAREVGITVVLALGLLLFVDGALFNPSGFAARLHFLLGTASQDHAYYPPGLPGALRVVRDMGRAFDGFYPLAFAPFVLGGVAVAWSGAETRAKRVAGLVPLFAAISFTLAFNCTARRTEHRFLLPQSLLLAVYAGLAWDAFTRWVASRANATVAIGLASLGFGWALYGCVAVDVNLLFDPRYDAERWLAANARPGEVVEAYGGNVYLPRFSADGTGPRVVRVDPSPVEGRSPLPGVEEIQAPFEEATSRSPRFIVMSESWVLRYFVDEGALTRDGLMLSAAQKAAQSDAPAQVFFARIHHAQGGYHPAHFSTFESRWWPRLDIHASTAREIRIFERD